jgi:heme a synthase
MTLSRKIVNGVAMLLGLSILVLICSGGLVTSHEAGMAVPDWPNTFGYNMFLFPVSRWVGGVLFEHTHRLIATGVGLLTILLCVVAFIFEQRRWIKVLCVVALIAVVIQGVLGGLRVTEHNTVLGLFHGCLAQAYLCLVWTIALATSPLWDRLPAAPAGHGVSQVRFWTIVATGMVFFQLVLGAMMRHSHAGLSIHDFPTVYGKWLPPVDHETLARINEARLTAHPPQPPTSIGLIHLQYLHRGWAVLVFLTLGMVGSSVLRQRWLPGFVRFLAGSWPALVVIQIAFGAWTVLSNKAADVATAHVFVGALTLVLGVLLSTSLSATLLRSSHSSGQTKGLDKPAVARAPSHI